MSVATIKEILTSYPDAKRDSLIPILQKVQDSEGFLSKDSILAIGNHMNLPPSRIYGVATFYNQFRFHPLGHFHIQVCRGTACHVKGSAAVMQRIEHELQIGPNETTRDGLFSLEVVACIGACGLAPVISINGKFHAKLSPDDVSKVLNTYRTQAEEEPAE